MPSCMRAPPAAVKLFPDLSRSEELERALDQFTRRARTPFVEEAPMLVQEWGALLQALGLPSADNPLDAAGGRSGESGARTFAARAEAALRAAPPYAEWMQRALAR